MDNFSLHAYTPAMNDPNLTKTMQYHLVQVFFDHDSDFPRLEGMKINRVLNRDFVHNARI